MPLTGYLAQFRPMNCIFNEKRHKYILKGKPSVLFIIINIFFSQQVLAILPWLRFNSWTQAILSSQSPEWLGHHYAQFLFFKRNYAHSPQYTLLSVACITHLIKDLGNYSTQFIRSFTPLSLYTLVNQSPIISNLLLFIINKDCMPYAYTQE